MNLLLNKPRYPIADLHCDLLCYLSRNPARTAYDLAARCSIPQLKKGNVKIQTMAIFTETSPESVASGLAQGNAFKMLPKNHPEIFEFVRQPHQFEELRTSNKIGILPAMENASSFCSEDDNLEFAFQRLTTLQRKIGKLAYLSLTWNTENRFGGGALTNIGLKHDGMLLIDYLHKNGIALDFSHASDYLATDILNYIDKQGYHMFLLASHSNFRTVANAPRNLPDDLAKEILKRKGIIGLNFIRPFIGEASQDNFVKQLEHALRIGAHHGICLGADFFYAEDVSSSNIPRNNLYFPEFENAECYPSLVELWKKKLSPPESTLEQICYTNLTSFLTRKF